MNGKQKEMNENKLIRIKLRSSTLSYQHFFVVLAKAYEGKKQKGMNIKNKRNEPKGMNGKNTQTQTTWIK